MDLKAQKDADLISAQLANQSLSDRLTAMKEADLISLRDSIDEWCVEHQESKWGHRFWIIVVMLGVFAFIQGVTDIFVSGVSLLDIFLIVLLITCLYGKCSFENAIKIGAIEFILKLLIYYLHERIWQFFIILNNVSKKKLIIKSVSWRIVGTTTTFIITGAVLKNFYEAAFFIALLELISKFILYYFHERFWLKIPFGYLNNNIKI